MIEYAVVILEKDSTSFCYYNNETKSLSSDRQLMSIELLESIVSYAIKNNLTVHYLYGNTALPKEYETLINKIEHTKIQPISYPKIHKNAILVINPDELDLLAGLRRNLERNIILRIGVEQINNLSQYVTPLLSKCKRINIMLLDMDKFTQVEYDLYQKEITSVSKQLTRLYKSSKSTELNIVTDRMLLSEMNNCNAGLSHFTIAPNGEFYLCPGFYYSGSDDSIGNIRDGLFIKNAYLLELDKAPICRNCDAYQCKRCIYLNKQTTLEINTPSQQQCIVSHIERNNSKKILELLSQEIKEFQYLPEIPEIDYMDPFELVKYNNSFNAHDSINVNDVQDSINVNSKETDLGTIPNNIDNLTDRELLESIFRMQNEIINRLTK